MQKYTLKWLEFQSLQKPGRVVDRGNGQSHMKDKDKRKGG